MALMLMSAIADESLNIPRSFVSTHCLGATLHDGVSAEATGEQVCSPSWKVGTALALVALWVARPVLPSALLLCPFTRVLDLSARSLGDLSGHASGVNAWLHPCTSIMLGLPDPVQSDTMQARVPLVAPVAAACTRSTAATWVDRDHTDTVLKDQHLTDDEVRLMQEEADSKCDSQDWRSTWYWSWPHGSTGGTWHR